MCWILGQRRNHDRDVSIRADMIAPPLAQQ
jgi:hypothetical protein